MGSDDSGRFVSGGKTGEAGEAPEAMEGTDARTAEPTSGERVGHDAFELRDVVETALARALVLAAEGQRWELVAQIATELAERRKARDSNRAESREVPTAWDALTGRK